jgi:hypothetical protein
MSDDPLREYEAHLAALSSMSPEEATALRDELRARRARINGQLRLVEQVLAELNRTGKGPVPWVRPGQEPLIPASGPPESGVKPPSRRMFFLSLMSQDPERDWLLQEIKSEMVRAGLISDNADGSDRVSAVAYECKGKAEIVHVGPGAYRITDKGLAAAANT